MLKNIGAVVAGYIVMFVLVFVTFSAAYLAMGAEGAFKTGSYEVTALWLAVSFVLSFIAALGGGFVCAAIAKNPKATLALAGLVLVLGLLLVLAFAQPTLPWKRSLFEHVVVLDITQSMNVEDMQLDGKPAARLAFAKRMLHDALDELPCGSRLGWAIFTEYRTYLLYTPVEVCANRAELRASLKALRDKL